MGYGSDKGGAVHRFESQGESRMPAPVPQRECGRVWGRGLRLYGGSGGGKGDSSGAPGQAVGALERHQQQSDSRHIRGQNGQRGRAVRHGDQGGRLGGPVGYGPERERL